MKNILSYKKFTEAISGTFDVMPFGPGFPRPESPNTISANDTSVIFSDITNTLYTYDDYNNLYEEYLKKQGKPLEGFNKENLETILTFK